jgi:mannose-6-phosphate isomerase-like protein (cupin superfamily)
MRSYAKTVEFFRNASQAPVLADGYVLALHHASGPHDVHYPTWEMHPEGDELLILASGSLSVEFRGERAKRMAALSPQAALVVPAGVWHRVIVHEPSVLIAVTPCHNTVHEKV